MGVGYPPSADQPNRYSPLVMKISFVKDLSLLACNHPLGLTTTACGLKYFICITTLLRKSTTNDRQMTLEQKTSS